MKKYKIARFLEKLFEEAGWIEELFKAQRNSCIARKKLAHWQAPGRTAGNTVFVMELFIEPSTAAEF